MSVYAYLYLLAREKAEEPPLPPSPPLSRLPPVTRPLETLWRLSKFPLYLVDCVAGLVYFLSFSVTVAIKSLRRG